MDVEIENAAWDAMTRKEKNDRLFLLQIETLDKFLERGAISQAQHDRCLSDLTRKMGEKT